MTAMYILQSLVEFGDELDRDYQTCADLPPDALAIILAAIRDCRAELAALAKVVEADLIATAGKKRFVVPGLGEVEVKKSKKYTHWNDRDLAAVVVARALDERVLDETSGEYEPREQAVARVLMECARPSWRLTPLRDRGIDESEFCTIEDDGWSVRLPPKGK